MIKYSYICFFNNSNYAEDISSRIPFQKGDEFYYEKELYTINKIVYKYLEDGIFNFPTLIVTKNE